MIAKEVAKKVGKGAGAGGFGALVAYLTNSQGKAERVGEIRMTNCVSVDHPSAVLEVENAQLRNSRAGDKTYHLILSFRPGDDPSPATLAAIEEQACAALGFSTHHRVSVVHGDTDHLHLHVAINKVRKDGTVHSPSFSKLTLDRLCVELERQYGLAPDRHQFVEREPEVQRVEAMREHIQEQCGRALVSAESWADLFQVAAEHGFEVRAKGRGLVLVNEDGTTVRASSVERGLGRASLEKRLGAFEGAGEPGDRPAVADPPSEAPGRLPDFERTASEESLMGFVRRNCGDALKSAQSWREIHAIAREHGLEVTVRGNGLVIASGEHAVKASSVARSLSKAALEKRLGYFEPDSSAQSARVQYVRKPLQPTQALYERYVHARERVEQERSVFFARSQQQRAKDWASLKKRSQQRRTFVKLAVKGKFARTVWRVAVRQADARDRAALKRKHAAQRGHVPTTLTWLAYLRQEAERGNSEALDALRRRSLQDVRKTARNNQVIAQGDSKSTPALALVDHITKTGTVVYRMVGGTAREDAKGLHLARGGSDAAAEGFLHLALARYGQSVRLAGDDAFKERMVRVAAQAQLVMTFSDASLEAKRIALIEELHGDGRGQRAASVERGERSGDERRAIAQGATRLEGPSRSEHRKARKPNALEIVRRTTTTLGTRVRDLSSFRLVFDREKREGVLQTDARDHMGQRRPEAPDHIVRRPADGGGLKPEGPKGRKGR